MDSANTPQGLTVKVDHGLIYYTFKAYFLKSLNHYFRSFWSRQESHKITHNREQVTSTSRSCVLFKIFLLFILLQRGNNILQHFS